MSIHTPRLSSPLPLSSMALFSNYISFLFLATLLLPLQLNARDSQFFSKVTHVNNNNNVKETELPNKKGPVNQPEQQPVFIPETENSYGLYGHESTQLPSTPTPTTTATTDADPYTTTTTYQPYKTEFEDTSKYRNSKYYNYNNDVYNTDHNEISNTRLTGTGYGNNNNYYNNDAYVGNQNELSDTKYTEGGYNSMENQNKNQKYYYDRNAANDRHNGERQGMSDTRFLEGGKYFYDINYEKYNPTLYGDSARGVNTNKWYNNRGGFGHNNPAYFGNNNANSYNYKNSKEGYQNQEEFEDDQDDFEP